MEHTYIITGMTCAGCQYKVQKLLSEVEGVDHADVDLEHGEARIQMDKHIDTAVLQQALKEYPKYQLSEKQVHMPANDWQEPEEARSWISTYKPILLIFSYILAVAAIVTYHSQADQLMMFMRVFMAGFFLVFSFFKMLNLDAFADSYAMYDVIALKFKGWGYIYAFTELALGIAYVTGFNPAAVNVITLVVMAVSIIGVLQTVLNKRAIRCACLGAVFNLPMSTVTIVEDGLMIAMSALMLMIR